jgi:pectate lyase
MPNVANGFAAVNALGQNGTTGGAGGPTVTVSTTEAFLDYIARPGPYVIRVQGTITLPTGTSDGMHDVSSDKTILGVGSNATLSGGGLNIGLPIDDDVTSPPANAVHNIIIRNLRITGATDDLLNVQMFSHHVWIDHNEFDNGDDGAVDIKRGSDWITVSWNHFHDHDKTTLVGHDDDNAAQDTGRLRVTYHHNYFNASDQRNPRACASRRWCTCTTTTTSRTRTVSRPPTSPACSSRATTSSASTTPAGSSSPARSGGWWSATTSLSSATTRSKRGAR